MNTQLKNEHISKKSKKLSLNPLKTSFLALKASFWPTKEKVNEVNRTTIQTTIERMKAQMLSETQQDKSEQIEKWRRVE